MKRRKILLNIGTLVSLACPVAIVLSCGKCNNNSDDSKKINQDKMNGITAAMVKAALNITPSSFALPSTINQPGDSTATLNGLDDVSMTISKWTHDDPNGEINADVSISKPGSGLKPPSSPFNIKWTGFKTTGQQKMNGITAAMVKTALNITPSNSALPSTISQPGNSTATLNHLAGVSITINQWTHDDPNGKIIADVSVSKTGLTPPTSSPFTIEWTGYLTTNQHKMNGITAAMVKKALNITPSSSALPSTINQPGNSTATLNHLAGVSMTITKWTQDNSHGKIVAIVSVSKTGLISPTTSPFSIELTGYLTTDQDKMNGITTKMVKTALNITPNNSALPSTITKPGDSTATLNHLDGVSITISKWTQDDPNGKIIADVSVSKTGLTPPTTSPFSIEWTGYLTTDQHKMNGITADMVKTALNITPSNSALPSTITKPGDSTATLNHLAGVSITISQWTHDDPNGKIIADVSVSKTGLISPTTSPFSIEWTGYLTTDQHKMNGITADMVKTALNITPSNSALPSTITKPGDSTATLNHLAGVSITISQWTHDDPNGKIIADVSVSKTGLTPPTSSPFTIEWKGYLTTDQHKMNGITAAMVKAALNITPSNSALPSTITKPGDSTATLNHLADVSITITKWTQDNPHGKIVAIVSVSKTGLISPTTSPFSIEWTGYLTTDQDKMNGITTKMVKDALTKKLNPPTIAAPTAVSDFTATLNGLDGVLIISTSLTPNVSAGTIEIATIKVSKTGLTSPNNFTNIIISGFKINLNWNHVDAPATLDVNSGSASSSVKINPTTLLVGTYNKGFWKVDTTDLGAWKWNSLNLSTYGFDEYSGNSSSLILTDKNTLLVGTLNKGFWKVDIADPNNWIWTREQETKFTDSSASYSLFLLVDQNTLLVGTKDKGFWIVDINHSAWTWVKEQPPGFNDRSAFAGLAVKTNKNTLLVGTQDKGFWKVDITVPTAWAWTKEQKTEFTHGGIAWDSPIIKVNENTLLVGTRQKGFWKVNITDPTVWVWTKENVNTLTGFSGVDSRLVKINSTTLLVGTQDKGFWKVNITDPDNWIWTREQETKFTDSSGIKASWVHVNKNTLLVGTEDKGFFIIYY